MNDLIAQIDEKSRILFFDLEMTGGNVHYDDIIQFSIVDLYEGVIFNKYIKPRKVKSWKDTEEIHHITPAMLAGEKNIAFYRGQLKNIMNHADMIIGFGIENDLKFMYKDYIRGGKHTIIYDIQKSYGKLYSNSNVMPSLENCANYYGCPNFGELHDSLTDTYMITYIFTKMYNLDTPDWLKNLIVEK